MKDHFEKNYTKNFRKNFRKKIRTEAKGKIVKATQLYSMKIQIRLSTDLQTI